MRKHKNLYCQVQENIHTPSQKGLEISRGVGGSVRPKNVKKCMKLNWVGAPSRGGEVWIFSGIRHSKFL